MSAVPSGAAPGVYKPRRPQASPLFRLVSDHFCAFHHACVRPRDSTRANGLTATAAFWQAAPGQAVGVADAAAGEAGWRAFQRCGSKSGKSIKRTRRVSGGKTSRRYSAGLTSTIRQQPRMV